MIKKEKKGLDLFDLQKREKEIENGEITYCFRRSDRTCTFQKPKYVRGFRVVEELDRRERDVRRERGCIGKI